MSKKKQDLSVEEMKKALEIKITPREQKELQKMSWEDMISKAMLHICIAKFYGSIEFIRVLASTYSGGVWVSHPDCCFW